MGLVTSSVQTNLDATERLGLRKETKFGRYFEEHQGVRASTQWSQVFAAAHYFDGLQASSTELNKMEGMAASSTELGVLEGITSSSKELNFLDGCASTGKLVTYQHIPWGSSLIQRSTAVVASSTGMRCVIASSMLSPVSSAWFIPKTRFGLASIVAAQAQMASTRSVWAMTDVASRHATTLVTSILPRGSTVIVRQYGALGATAGSLRHSTGTCNLQVFAYGFGSS